MPMLNIISEASSDELEGTHDWTIVPGQYVSSKHGWYSFCLYRSDEPHEGLVGI